MHACEEPGFLPCSSGWHVAGLVGRQGPWTGWSPFKPPHGSSMAVAGIRTEWGDPFRNPPREQCRRRHPSSSGAQPGGACRPAVVGFLSLQLMAALAVRTSPSGEHLSRRAHSYCRAMASLGLDSVSHIGSSTAA